MSIPGVPDGWALVRIGKPRAGESCIDLTGQLFTWPADCVSNTYPIVREVDPPSPTYRPYANAEEFRPERGRWIKSKDKDIQDERLRVTVYNDGHVIFNDQEGSSYQELLDDYVFENDEPCGVRVP